MNFCLAVQLAFIPFDLTYLRPCSLSNGLGLRVMSKNDNDDNDNNDDDNDDNDDDDGGDDDDNDDDDDDDDNDTFKGIYLVQVHLFFLFVGADVSIF